MSGRDPGVRVRLGDHAAGCECAGCERRRRWDRDAERAIHLFWCSRRRWPTLEENRTLPDPADYARHSDYLSALETWAQTTAHVDHTSGPESPPIES